MKIRSASLFASAFKSPIALLAGFTLISGKLSAQGDPPKLEKPAAPLVAVEGEGENTTKPERPPGLPPVEAEKPPKEDEELRMVVRLRDGTVVMGKPLTTEFPIDTPYGRLSVPLEMLRSATFGLRIPKEDTAEARKAIDLLGGADFKLRDKAQATLRNMGEKGLTAISEALAAGADLETQKRLKAVLEEVAPDGIDSMLMDSLNAGDLRAGGKITIDALEVDCSLGRLSITLDKLKEIRSLGGTAFSEGFESFSAKGSGWEMQAGNNTAWQVDGRRPKDGKSAMWCGVKGGNQYSDNANATLTSPAFDTSALDSPVLQFHYWLKMEDGADSLTLEFSKDGGGSWEGGNQFSSNGTWAQQRVDLSGMRSRAFRFRFRFQSDGSSVDEGAFLDGFTVGEADEME